MFATDSAYADLLVVVVPQNGPRITGLHKKRSGVSYNLWVVTSPAKHSTMIVTSFVISRYSIGDSLELNCSSELTLPPANLTWYINQRPVIKIYKTNKHPRHPQLKFNKSL